MNRYCVYQNYTIKEVIERIDASKNRVVIVLNRNQKVIGVISQGDIIRALIADKNLYAQIDSIIRPNFIYLNEKDMEKAFYLFKKRNITLLPIVDEEFSLLDVISMDDIYKYMEEICRK